MIAVISLALVVLIPLIIWIRKSYFVVPELTIEFKKDGGSSSPIGFSNKNVAVDGVIEMRDAIQLFRLRWDIDIIITNNSEHNAFYPTMSFKETQPPFVRIEKLNELTPIASREIIKIKAVFEELEEAKGAERNDMKNLPLSLKDIQILLSYKNSAKSRSYTLYNNSDKSNKFFRRKPPRF